jgi:hypothetical protein
MSNGSAKHDDVIESVGAGVRNGFSSGAEFVDNNIEWWELFRDEFATGAQRHKEEVANLTHFDFERNRNKLLPPATSVEIISKDEAASHFLASAHELAAKIEAHGDQRTIDPMEAALQLMKEAFEESEPTYGKSGSFEDVFLKPMGISIERLPENPTVEDCGEELVFVNKLRVRARRLGMCYEVLLSSVRKEQLPSWVVWQGLHTTTKRIPRASVGNVNDHSIASFGPYVDILDCDKRTADCLRQASGHHETIRRVFGKVPKARGFRGLIESII